MKRYLLDIEKLVSEFEKKRKSRGLSRERIAMRYGLSKGSLNVRDQKSLDAKILIPILMYLKKPLDDFVKIVEVKDDGSS